MAQPPGYTPATDFSAEEANNQAGRSTVRTAQLDAELAALEVTLDAVLANMAVLQRDDLELRDGKVKLHTLADDVKSLLATTGCVVRGAWLTATLYQLKDIITQGGLTYICASAHTSGVFATDLAASRWIALNSELAANVVFTPAAGIAAGTVQAALEELGNQVGDGSASIGFRNRIINGQMIVDQRNYGAAVTSGYPRDRWRWDFAGTGTVSMQGLTTGTPPAGAYAYLRITVTGADASLAAGDTYTINTRIEGLHWYDMAWGSASAKPCTLSFLVRSSLTGTFGGALSDAGGALGYPFSFTINQANTWESKTITIPGPTSGTWTVSSNTILIVRFGLGSGANFSGTAGAWAAGNLVQPTGTVNVMGTNGATFDLTNVQLEAGTVATPFEIRDFGSEVRLCRRYYARYDNPMMRGVAQSATQVARLGMVLPVQMRANPIATILGTLWCFDATSAVPITSIGTSFLRVDGIEFDVTCSAGAFTVGRAVSCYTNDTGGIALDAEVT